MALYVVLEVKVGHLFNPMQHPHTVSSVTGPGPSPPAAFYCLLFPGVATQGSILGYSAIQLFRIKGLGLSFR